MPEFISVTSETVDATFPELPRLVRLALGFGSKLQHGTLDVTLADDRIVRLGEWEKQRLYFAGVVHPRPRLKQGRSPCQVRVDRRSMDRPCPS